MNCYMLIYGLVAKTVDDEDDSSIEAASADDEDDCVLEAASVYDDDDSGVEAASVEDDCIAWWSMQSNNEFFTSSGAIFQR